MEQQIRFCATADGVNLAYATTGTGAPLVKAANWLSHLEFDWQSPVWRHWHRELSRDHLLVRYDERGCGLSDRNVQEFSFEAWVQDLEAVVDELALDRFALLGISRGGAISVAYAALHPERVSQLVLYGAYARGWRKRSPTESMILEREALITLTENGWGRDNPAYRQIFTSGFMPEATAEQMHWFNDLQRISTSPEIAARLQRESGNIDVSDLARQVTAPTLVLHGREDGKVLFDEGRRLAALIPGARFVQLESKNHILLEHEPAWHKFLKEVRGFLGDRQDSPEVAPLSAEEVIFTDLTVREREVLDLLARGYRNQEIARELVLSPKTVRNYVSNIFSKLAVSGRGEAIVLARKAGLGE